MLFALMVPFVGTAVAEHGEEDVAVVDLEPEEDSAAVGTCNEFIVTATDDDGDEAEGEVIDVQASQEFEEGEDAPNLRFCEPATFDEDEVEGQEPAGEGGTTRQEDVDCPTTEGTNEDCVVIHGEFVTDENGQVRFGIMSDQEGETTVTAFHEPDCGEGGTGEDADEAGLETQPDGPDEGTEPDFVQAEDRDDEDECNDEPDAGEPQDTSLKTWTSGEAAAIDCEPEDETNQLSMGEDWHDFECTLTNEEGDPVGGEGDIFFEVTAGPNSEADGDEDDGVEEGEADAFCTDTATGEEGELFLGQEDPEETQETGEAYCYYEEDDDGESGESGTDTILACWDEDGDEECENDEPSDEIQKTWVGEARRIDCTPEAATNESGTTHTITCTVTDAFGQRLTNETGDDWEGWFVVAELDGVGRFSQQDIQDESCWSGSEEIVCDYTDENGQVEFVLETSPNEIGNSNFTASINENPEEEGWGGGEFDEDADCKEDANQPNEQGEAQGQCTDAATKTWVEDIPGPAACEDGIDNDQDGMIDHSSVTPTGQTADPGCESPTDPTEAPNPDEDPVITRHNRTVKLKGFDHVNLPGRKRPQLEVKARVRHNDDHPEASCQQDVPVNFQIKAERRWITRKSATTNNRGIAKVLIQDVPAKYRAKAPRHAIEDEQANTVDVCRRAISEPKRHRHRR